MKKSASRGAETGYTFKMDQVARLFADFRIKLAESGRWVSRDLDLLYQSIEILAQSLGGGEGLKTRLGEVLVERVDTGTHLALAYNGRIQLSEKAPFTSWSVVHELSHAWDAKNQWRLSRMLERYTGGFTFRFLSRIKKWIPGQWDAGRHGPQHAPGRYGRKPGVNASGYFYGDTPSGSNWQFNRKEDFAESLVMYCGWGRDNPLSRTAHGRIERYTLPNGGKDPIYQIADNWSDYARYFYPEGGDYTKTRRWQFMDKLIHGEIKI